MSKTAILRVSEELLREALHLPEGTTIDAMQKCFEAPGTFELRVSHEGLREVPPGHILPFVKAEFESVEAEAPGREILFLRWAE